MDSQKLKTLKVSYRIICIHRIKRSGPCYGCTDVLHADRIGGDLSITTALCVSLNFFCWLFTEFLFEGNTRWIILQSVVGCYRVNNAFEFTSPLFDSGRM